MHEGDTCAYFLLALASGGGGGDDDVLCLKTHYATLPVAVLHSHVCTVMEE